MSSLSHVAGGLGLDKAAGPLGECRVEQAGESQAVWVGLRFRGERGRPLSSGVCRPCKKLPMTAGRSSPAKRGEQGGGRTELGSAVAPLAPPGRRDHRPVTHSPRAGAQLGPGTAAAGVLRGRRVLSVGARGRGRARGDKSPQGSLGGRRRTARFSGGGACVSSLSLRRDGARCLRSPAGWLPGQPWLR